MSAAPNIGHDLPQGARVASTFQVVEPHALSCDAVLDVIGGGPDGLSGSEATERLSIVGLNRLPEPKKKHPLLRFLTHFADILIYILLAAAAVKAVFGDWLDAGVILAVAVINALIGFLQEGRAEKAMQGLRTMLSLRARVLRDGVWTDTDAQSLVPGDVVRVKSGDRVPADLRLLNATMLRVEESSLTGESVPSDKHPEPVAHDAGIGDRQCMLYSGTLVAAGLGVGVVTATGIATELGRIQTMIGEVETLDTPLTRKLNAFGKRISLIILGVAGMMALVGWILHGQSGNELFSAVISFAVAAIPEGLPALVTITLAIGVQRMAKRNAITRKLTAVETLGSVTTICTDKTGTLTRNEMTARTVVTADAQAQVSGIGYAPTGDITVNDVPVNLSADQALHGLVEVMAVCNDASLTEKDGHWHIVGEPTEGSLRTLASKAGFEAHDYDRLATVPFDSVNKFMATLGSTPTGADVILVKGAPDRLLELCTTQLTADGSTVPLDTGWWEQQVDSLSAEGLRVLAAARGVPQADQRTLQPEDLNGLTFLGIVGIVDPPRPEAVAAIAACHNAGIRVKMITGDHAGTARAIAQEMGIITDTDARVAVGAELESMSQDQLASVVRDIDVYARTSPEHKLRIVTALQAHAEVVAMTGDGVNDAPALTRADVGVAMGIKGTEASKEAAAIVLADDNFASIERAVKEGRRIYDNLQKSIVFLLPTSFAQALVILIAVLFGFTPPLQPTQILWINLITAVTLALALAYEPAEGGIMDRPPRQPGRSILPRDLLARVVLVSTLISGATIAVYFFELANSASFAQAQTSAVTMLALGQLAYLFNARFLRSTSLRFTVLTGNRMVWISVGALLLLQLLFVYTPIMNTWFHSTPIGLREWGIVLGLSAAIFLLVEVGKTVERAVARRSR
ncbi:potassium/sodium efflux P-type ATPase [Rhodoglobus vestalii]|uniref:Potassium/sodium efflux P-type ATPase n=1 Tax=Rhodoglobus vestalii TaxID=193384 RepID=A0A8H2PXY4_9MICO|nr:HAD-IC family P-type ATPase [Rhodoglobus vestalii]TQO20695.1 potassium/sodium efflux P-type ATPase [Rhodoglobus vestalii]